jgi:hypothetical protein
LSSLEFKKIKDAEVAWLDSKIAQKEVEDLVHADDVAMAGTLCDLLSISIILSYFYLEPILGEEIPTLEPVKDLVNKSPIPLF